MTDVALITGIPGSGKTTVAKKLAEKVARSAFISGDNLRTSVIGGFKNPAKPWDEETRRQYYLSFENEAALAQNYIKNGFKAIIDDVVHGGDLFSQWKKYFKNMRYQPILLFPSLDEVLKRNRERGKFISESIITKLYNDFARQDYSGWIVIDTSNLTLKNTVAKIKESLSW